MIKFSIIIPVYKVETYIIKCLQSVINQTYTNWEAICIDDASPDKCPQILDNFASKDKRIKIIHKANEGVSVARNTGLDAVSGDFVVFLDSDDFLHPQVLEICAYYINRDNSDLVAYTYNRNYRSRSMILSFLGIYSNKYPKFPKYEPEKIETIVTKNIFDYVVEESNMQISGVPSKFRVKHCQAWRCCYRYSAIKDLRFPLGIIYEDFPWWGEVLRRINIATINNLPIYYYYANKRSYILSSSQIYRVEQLEKAIEVAKQIEFTENERHKQKIWQERFIDVFTYHLNRKRKKYRL